MDQETTRARWATRLQNPSGSRIPTDYARVSPPRFIRGEYSTKVDADMHALIATFATENDTTPFIVLLSAFAIVIHRITGDEDTIIGTNLTAPAPFPIRVKVSSNCSFWSLLQTVREVRAPLSDVPLCRLGTLLNFFRSTQSSRQMWFDLTISFNIAVAFIPIPARVQIPRSFIWHSTRDPKSRLKLAPSWPPFQPKFQFVCLLIPMLAIVQALKDPSNSWPPTIGRYFCKTESRL